MIGVKICGITDTAALAAAAEAGADWVGFVFYPPSPRALTPSAAAAISAAVPGGPARVGLFVAPSDAAIRSVLAALPLDALQVYADIDRVAALCARFGLPVWQAVGVATQADLPRAAADRLVIEAKPPPGATRPGGNAVAIDWAMLAGWTAPAPWLLAGGLTPDNVAAAIAASGAAAVDVSSGVERQRGVKDPALIRAFIRAARQRTSAAA